MIFQKQWVQVADGALACSWAGRHGYIYSIAWMGWCLKGVVCVGLCRDQASIDMCSDAE